MSATRVERGVSPRECEEMQKRFGISTEAVTPRISLLRSHLPPGTTYTREVARFVIMERRERKSLKRGTDVRRNGWRLRYGKRKVSRPPLRRGRRGAESRLQEKHIVNFILFNSEFSVSRGRSNRGVCIALRCNIEQVLHAPHPTVSFPLIDSAGSIYVCVYNILSSNNTARVKPELFLRSTCMSCESSLIFERLYRGAPPVLLNQLSKLLRNSGSKGNAARALTYLIN